MDAYTYLKIRNYVAQILREGILKESVTGSALAAKVARVLIDISIDNYPETGMLYMNYYRGDEDEKTYRPFYIKGRELNVLSDDGSGFVKLRSWSSQLPTGGIDLPEDLKYHGRSSHSYLAYAGDVSIITSGLMNKYNINFNTMNQAVQKLGTSKEISKLKDAGNDFLSYVTNEKDREQLIKSFGSISALGFFAAIFAVIIPAGGSPGALGHVSGETANSPYYGQVLTFRENRMTVSDKGFNKRIKNQLPSPAQLGRQQTSIIPNEIDVGSSLKKLAARNTTYIHELQHLIQHAVYQTPGELGANIEMSDDDPKKYHPYNIYQSGGAQSAAVIHGMVKSKRPSSQQIEVMSELLAAAKIIDPTEKKVSGINSPLFDYIGPTIGKYTGDKPRVAMTLESSYDSDSNLEESWKLQVRAFGFRNAIKDQLNLMLSGIPNKKKPEEREAQLARFGSAKGKKAVGRKYRFFLADALENADLAKRILNFDSTDADSKTGPEDIKKRPFDESNTGTSLDKAMSNYLANKGGKLSANAFSKVALGMPTVALYLAAADISFSATDLQGAMLSIPLPWLKKYIDKNIYKEIVKIAKATKRQTIGFLPDDLKTKIVDALDIKVAITQPLSLVPSSSKAKIAAIAGYTSRTQPGVAEIGAAWYKRAANYIWPRMETEYDAEFVAANGFILYNLYLLGTGKTDQMDRRTLSKIENETRALFQAIIEENIERVEEQWTNLRPSSRHSGRFIRYIPSEVRGKKSDQDRRLAIDLIEAAQDISDEELDKITKDAAIEGLPYNSIKWPRDSEKFEEILQSYIDSGGNDESDRFGYASYDFLKAFRLKFFGLIGKKFLS